MAVNKTLVHASFWCFFCWKLGSSSRDHKSYLGCFYDNYDPGGEPMRVLPNGYSMQTYMTIGLCINFCVASTTDASTVLRYAGLEAGAECWCGAEGAQYDKYGERDDNECSKPCDGNTNQTCGADFRIAVYNLSLIRCQIPEHLGAVSSLLHFVPINEFTTFSCLPGYELIGPHAVQCIFDDVITDTRWSSDLPECIRKPTTTYVESSTTNNITPMTGVTTGGTGTLSANTAIIGAVAGGCGLLAIICATLVILVCIRKRKQKGVAQTQSTPMSPTTYGHNNNPQPEPSVSSFPEDLYSRPIRPASRGQTNQETDNVYHAAPQVQKKKPKVIQSYEYADVQINSKNVADTNQFDQNEPEEAGWADNSIYGRTEDSSETLGEDDEGWKENNIYVTSSQ